MSHFRFSVGGASNPTRPIPMGPSARIKNSLCSLHSVAWTGCDIFCGYHHLHLRRNKQCIIIIRWRSWLLRLNTDRSWCCVIWEISGVYEYLNDNNSELSMLNRHLKVRQMFIRCSTCLPSSAPVERLFSSGALVLTKRWNRLSDELFETLLMLKINKNYCHSHCWGDSRTHC